MDFIKFAEQYGLLVGDMIMDGAIHRVPVKDGKPGRKDGAYCLYDDRLGRAGWVMNFKTGEYQTYGECANNDSETALIRELQKKEKQQERQQLYNKTAQTAEYLVKYIFMSAQTHPYLVRKRVKAHNTYIDKVGALIVPLRNISGEIRTFQRINEDGFKSYLRNGEMAGCFFQFGDISNQVIICEGFSTGASIYESTEVPTVSAMNDGNLPKVALAFREKYGDSLEIIIAGDNDHRAEGNPGKRFAIKAAKECKGRYVLPEFTKKELEKNLTDFNDLMISRGIKIVKMQIFS